MLKTLRHGGIVLEDHQTGIVFGIDRQPFTEHDLDSGDYSDSTPDVTYTYGRLGRRKTITRNGMTTTLSYNDAGLVTGES